MDARNFRRKVLTAPGFVEETGKPTPGVGRPVRLYTRGTADGFYPPLQLS